jgi:hypothetical protein
MRVRVDGKAWKVKEIAVYFLTAVASRGSR